MSKSEIVLTRFESLVPLGGRCGNLGQNVVFFRIFFYRRKFIFGVWLITSQKIMSLRAREPPKIGVIYVL